MSLENGALERLRRAEKDIESHETALDTLSRTVERHEGDIHSERGLYQWMKSMEARLVWVNRALWAIALAIIGSAAAIIFAGGHP